jgi:hypothetical protein
VARLLLEATLALALLGTGWAVARAQTSEPDFELRVDAPAGQTTITCVRGCKLKWVERGINPRAGVMSSFEYGCEGATVQRCGSGKIGGWINP